MPRSWHPHAHCHTHAHTHTHTHTHVLQPHTNHAMQTPGSLPLTPQESLERIFNTSCRPGISISPHREKRSNSRALSCFSLLLKNQTDAPRYPRCDRGHRPTPRCSPSACSVPPTLTHSHTAQDQTSRLSQCNSLGDDPQNSIADPVPSRATHSSLLLSW